MFDVLRSKSFVLFGTNTILDKSLRLLQLPTHVSSLIVNRYQRNSWLYLLGCKLVRVGWVIHVLLINERLFVWVDPLTMALIIQ